MLTPDTYLRPGERFCRNCGYRILQDKRGVWRHKTSHLIGCPSQTIAEPEDERRVDT